MKFHDQNFTFQAIILASQEKKNKNNFGWVSANFRH